MAIIHWEDSRGDPLTRAFADSVGELLEEGLGHRPSLPSDRAVRASQPASMVHDPRLLAALARTTGARRLVRVALVSSSLQRRLYADHRPANRGLWKEEHLQRVLLRVSVQAPDGRYLYIDEVPGTLFDAYVYVLDRKGRHAPVEIFMDEPSGPPLHWTRRGGGGHLTL